MKTKFLLILTSLLLASCTTTPTSSIAPQSSIAPVSQISSVEVSSQEISSEVVSSEVSNVVSSNPTPSSKMRDEVTKEQFFEFYKANEEARKQLYKQVNLTVLDLPTLLTYDLLTDSNGEYFEFDPNAIIEDLDIDITDIAGTDLSEYIKEGESETIKVYIMANYSTIEQYIDEIEIPEDCSIHFFHHNGLTKSTNNLEIKGTIKTPEEYKEYLQCDTFDFNVQLDARNYIREIKIIVEDPEVSVTSTYSIGAYPYGNK